MHSSIPKRKTQVYTMKTKHDNSVFFHPESPEDADANMLYDKDAEEQDRRGR